MYKIKWFIKRNFKKILRLILIFGIISTLFVSNCFASSYDNFSQFMQGATAYGNYISPDGSVSGADIVVDDMGNYDSIYFHPIADVTGFELVYSNGWNFSRYYNNGDYVYLKHDCIIESRPSEFMEGSDASFSGGDDFYITLGIADKMGYMSYVTFNGRAFLKEVEFDEFPSDLYPWIDIKQSRYSIELNAPLPTDIDEPQIVSITYGFKNLYSGVVYSIHCAPSSGTTVLYEVGSPQNMPIYGQYNDPSFGDMESLESDFRDSVTDQINSGMESIGAAIAGPDSYMKHPMFLRGLTAAGVLVGDFVQFPFIKNMLWLSLVIGLSVFVLNIGSGIGAHFMSKRGD